MSERGKVKFYNESKGYGFIIRDDGRDDVFLHRTFLPEGLSTIADNTPITFDVETTQKGARAINVALG